MISALFIYLALRKVDLPRMWLVMRSADLLPLLMVIFITLLQYIIRAWRWGILLEPIGKTGFLTRLSSIHIGFAANFLLPARLGEFIRANTLGQKENISGSSTFGTIVVERLFDGFTLLLFLLIGLVFTSFPPEWRYISSSLRGAGFLIFFFYICLIIFLAGFKFKSEIFLHLLEKLLFFLPWTSR
ncbi:lysylphosphatidylglycerol synthase transmembrane domain-containing protein [Thermodesulfobacteriota bacterium]